MLMSALQEATRGHPKILNLTRGLPSLTESQRPGFPRVLLYKMCRSFVARQVARIVLLLLLPRITHLLLNEDSRERQCRCYF